MKIQKKYLIPIIGIIILLTIMLSIKAFNKRVRYETQDLEKCTITQFVEASGTINTVNTVSVG